MIQESLSRWELAYEEGRLCWCGMDLTELAQTHGTPLFVNQMQRAEWAVHRIRRSFALAGLDAGLFFSYKTNPLPSLLRRFAALDVGAEVISEYELWLAEKMGIGGKQTIVNGTVKNDALLVASVEANVACINLENIDEMVRLEKIAQEKQRRVRVGLRINPALRKSLSDFTLSTGTASCHIGFLPGTSEWYEAVRRMRESSWLELVGLHFHIGSGIRKVAPYARSVDKALRIWDELRRAGFAPSLFDIGGGFHIETSKEMNLWEALLQFGWNQSPSAPKHGSWWERWWPWRRAKRSQLSLLGDGPGRKEDGSHVSSESLSQEERQSKETSQEASCLGQDKQRTFEHHEYGDNVTGTTLLDEVALMCAQKLQTHLGRHNEALPQVLLEPGRALSSSSQLLLLTVQTVMERKRTRFVVCDGGAMSLSNSLLSEYHAILPTNREPKPPYQRVRLVGNLPTPLDFIALGRPMPKLEKGDCLAILDVGGYFTSLGNNFAGPRPGVVSLDGLEATLTRRHETFGDLVARDVLD